MALESGYRITLEGKWTKHYVNIKKTIERGVISEHVPTHRRPINDEELGDYLGGLMEVGGLCGSEVCLSLKEKRLGYGLKKRIGYGRVRGERYSIAKVEGVERVKELINGKRRWNTEKKWPYISVGEEGWWLAGLIDGKGRLKIKVSEVRVEIRLEIGSELWAREGKGSELIKKLDRYNLQSSKYKDYLKWRKVYRMIQEGEHLNEKGLKKILKIKKSMCKIKS